MHICHICSGMRGGPEVIVAQLANAQYNAGHSVSVVYSSKRDDVEKFKHLFPANTEYFAWDVERSVGIKDFRAIKALRAILIRTAPDIVHMHCSKAGGLGRIAIRQLGIPFIYSPHGLAYLQSNIRWWERLVYFLAEWLLARLVDGPVVASSRGEQVALRHVYSRAPLIENGLDANRIVEIAGLSPPIRPKTDRLRIVTVGRIEPQKAPDLVVEIAKKLPADWEWLWVGDGELRSILEQCNRIELLGWQPREAVLATVQTADVFLLASRWEGMPFSLLEAMALGLPCVVSNVPGNKDLVESGINGYVCNTTEEYVKALSRIAENSDLRRRLGEGAQYAIQNVFSLRIALGKWAKLYDVIRSKK